LAAEDRRRGELLREYLAGRHGDDLRNVLEVISSPKDRALFRLPAAAVDRQTAAPAS
jgi:hypothetical protein